MTNPFPIAARLRPVPLVAFAIFTARAAAAQTLTGTIVMHVTADSAPLPHAAIVTGRTGTVTDQSGVARFTLPTGQHTFRVTPVGYRPESLTVFVGVGTTNVTVPVRHARAFPHPPSSQASSIARARPAYAPEPVVAPLATATAPVSTLGSLPVDPPPARVAATRDDRLASEGPTFVQVAGRDAVDEQIDRSPGDVAGVLPALGGVRVQALSAGSGGVGIRIRGMPGRYAKILSDGLPLTGATPEGQDPLQIPVLGVERVEVTPGVTSALYGPTSLSGAVNVVSAAPTSPSEVVLNGTTREASDVAVFQTQTFSPEWAASLLAGRHYRNSGDPDGDGWAEVPGYKRVVMRPRAYWNRSPTSSWFMTGGWTSENRRSGTFADERLPDGNKYSDDADVRRGDAGTVGRIRLDTNTVVTVRASMTREWRTRWYGDNRERDRRNEVFGDVSVTKTLNENVLVGGVALDRDQYSALDVRGQDYRYTTPALYAQHTWTPDPRFAVTSAARLDLQSEFGDFVSPRVSVVLRPTDQWQLRLSRANGFYAPTPLTDETESFGLSHLERSEFQPEHALGWALDVDHTGGALDLGGSAYRTVVTHPLVVRVPPGSAEGFQLVNADEPAVTQGIDVHARYRAQPFRFALNYSYVDAVRPEISGFLGDGFEVDTTLRRVVPFNPRHSADVDWTYEREHDRVLGLEVHFTGRQVLADSSFGLSPAYATVDARFEKVVRRATVFVYAKNLTGVYQLQLGPVLRPSSGAAGQWADNVWAPLEGRVVNAGLRVSY